jgi:hypothetical protein
VPKLAGLGQKLKYRDVSFHHELFRAL